MKIGVSTASLYPMHTEDALLTLAQLGITDTEIFLCSLSELHGEILAHIRNTVAEYRLNVTAAHPFSSPLETLFLFSSYDRRADDLIDLYKRWFAELRAIGGTLFVVHGANADSRCPDDRYIERMARLIRAGREEGVTIAQENVSYCKSGDPDFLQMLARELPELAFVLDVKQARRCGHCPLEIADLLGDRILHLHLSDSDSRDPRRDCLKIGDGDFDFAELFRRTSARSASVELYRENYDDYTELADCVARLGNSAQGLCPCTPLGDF